MAPRPIITLLSDFGTADAYVAEMKAAILTHCPEANLVDVTHAIPRHDITAGAFALERAINAFPPGTIHVAVVDPGDGTARKLIVATIRGQFVFAPDNGLITWAVRRHGCEATEELVWRPPNTGDTFQGRDVLAPAGAMTAAGTIAENALQPLGPVMMLPIKPAATLAEAQVLAIDGFGNVITNVPGDLVEIGQHFGGRATVARTFADAPPRAAVAYIGSSGLVELAINGDSAAKKFRLKVGQKLKIQ